MLFAIVMIWTIGQRLIELMIAKRNEKWMKAQGAKEYGQDHYKWFIFLHAGFFLVLLAEVGLIRSGLPGWWWLPFMLFLTAQMGRMWVLVSLHRYWNTKIIVLPGATPVTKGPYRFMKHPNYIIVSVEILALPLMFGAYVTAVLFTVLNAMLILLIRIPAEEQAWRLYSSGLQERSSP
ncbi:isoprenylcysteine carboxyl methyltransferase family protein [Salsuginibacillus kocurii]|uniref:isoprenylcysteine carboxyl methyltransferase family protein n=1 Tax=Salsuginibacillus kocurii TaxID=427078 RepID=UPI00037EA43F|nr:isoprenylcysteine carboxylmethyltransferase family protein [Salsuginibacillus kocurii]